MAGFEDYSIAAKMRDIIRILVAKEVQLLRPNPRYATVVSINNTDGVCEVKYAESPNTAIPVRMGVIRPSAVDQTVRIEGPPHDRYVADVLGVAKINGTLL